MYQVIKYAPLVLHHLSVFKDTSYYNINYMDSDKEVISRLKFIGKVQKGEKINVKYMFVQPEGIATKISRTLFNQCSRQNTLNFIRHIINRSFEIIITYTSSKVDSQKFLAKNIITDLQQSKSGIINLKSTYIDDLKMCCDLDTLLQEIDSFLNEKEIILNDCKNEETEENEQ